jgi:hypothetical protein
VLIKNQQQSDSVAAVLTAYGSNLEGKEGKQGALIIPPAADTD